MPEAESLASGSPGRSSVPRSPCSGLRITTRRTPGVPRSRSMSRRPNRSTPVWFVSSATRLRATTSSESDNSTSIPGLTCAAAGVGGGTAQAITTNSERECAHKLLVVAAALGCAGGQAVGRTAKLVPRPLSAVPAVSVDSLLASLTVRQQVGQLIVPWLSVSYTALDDSLFQVAARWLDSLKVGGLIISVGSPLDIATKLNALQQRSRLPLLVSADLEWGAGMRVVGATAFPQIMAVGATGDPHEAYTIGAATAAEGRAVGIHANFAPDADVNNNPSNPIINIHPLGQELRTVSRP